MKEFDSSEMHCRRFLLRVPLHVEHFIPEVSSPITTISFRLFCRDPLKLPPGNKEENASKNQKVSPNASMAEGEIWDLAGRLVNRTAIGNVAAQEKVTQIIGSELELRSVHLQA
jgi:hypothetical protein